jgi:RND family efflux transporter MFP subunit
MAASLFLAACQEKQAEAPEPVRPVKIAKVEPRQDTRKISYSGSVRARTEADLAFRVGGKIIARPVDVGDRVEPGTVLAQLDTADLALGLKSADAALASATSQLAVTTSAYDRAKTLFARGFTSRSILDDRKLALDQAQSNLDAARSSRDQAVNQNAYSELKSDVAGVVTAVRAEAGQVVAAGSPVVTVARDGDKEVAIAVPESEIRFFHTGDKLGVRYWADPSIRQAGTVREIAGSADPTSRTFAIRVALPDDASVRLGMTALLEADVPTEAGGIVVPLAALTERDGESTVWIVDPATKTVEPRNVVTAAFAEDGIRITGGLKGGEWIVTAGSQFMTPGKAIRLDAETERTAMAAR